MLSTGAPGVHFGLLSLEVGQVDGFAKIGCFPPFEVLVTLDKLAFILLPFAVDVGLLGAGAFSPAFQLGSNQGRVIQRPLDGFPDQRLNRRGLYAASDVWCYNVVKYRAETAVACTAFAVEGATHGAPAKVGFCDNRTCVASSLVSSCTMTFVESDFDAL